MEIQRNKKYVDFFKRTKNEPIVILCGSRRSGKTYATLIYLGQKLHEEKNAIFQIFSERPEQRESGLFRDFNDIWQGFNYTRKSSRVPIRSKSSGSELKFINIPKNVHSFDFAKNIGKADFRFLNECNMFDLETFTNLLISNRQQLILDYNPTTNFWIDEYITDNNFIKTTWRDNAYFLTNSQIKEFLRWEKLGKVAPIGSYNYWRWQVLGEGNYVEISGDIFTTENIQFTKEIDQSNLTNWIIFADPSNARGGDFFALTLTAQNRDGDVFVIDTFSKNNIPKEKIAEQIKKWQKDYPIKKTFIETNGEIGSRFFNDCRKIGIKVDGWYSTGNKFERILTNFDIITNRVYFIDNINNREFVQQIYLFNQDCENDDNIDCLNNAILAYYRIFRSIKAFI